MVMIWVALQELANGKAAVALATTSWLALEQDKFGNWVINKKFNAEMLAEALSELEGFSYAPSEEVYWKHGRSTRNSAFAFFMRCFKR